MHKPKIKLVPRDVGVYKSTVKILTFEQTVKYIKMNFNQTNSTLTYIK